VTNENRSGAAESGRTGGNIAALAGALGFVASQVALITAVLYYFGWSYSHAFYGYFGVDVGMLGYSTPDYILRSINAVFWPGAWVLLVTGAAFGIHQRLLRPRLRAAGSAVRSGATAWLPVLAHGAGVLLLGVGAIGVWVRTGGGSSLRVGWPVALVVGVLLIGYSQLLRRIGPELPYLRPNLRLGRPAPAEPVSRGYATVLVGLAFFGFLWAVSGYASQKGTIDAGAVGLGGSVGKPAVVLYSVDRLELTGTAAGNGVLVQPMPGAGKYQYQYSGIRMLAHAGDHYYLIPRNWLWSRDRTFVVRDSDALRVDLAPGS
jgi:hypothetical protein